MEMENLYPNIKHNVDLLSAALPFAHHPIKNSMEVAIKIGELMDTLNTPNVSLSACDLKEEPVDLEALLTSLQPVCNNSEREFINLLLNFTKTRSLYHSYQAFREFSSPQGSNESGNGFSNNSLAPMLDFFLSQMNPPKPPDSEQ